MYSSCYTYLIYFVDVWLLAAKHQVEEEKNMDTARSEIVENFLKFGQIQENYFVQKYIRHSLNRTHKGLGCLVRISYDNNVLNFESQLTVIIHFDEFFETFIFHLYFRSILQKALRHHKESQTLWIEVSKNILQY